MVQIYYMKQVPGLCLVLSLVALGTGCASDTGLSDISQAKEEVQKCNVLDYGIQEFSLLSSMPIVSHAYDLNLVLEKIGDCEIKELNISIYEDDILLKQYLIDGSKSRQSQKISWIPKTDGRIKLRAELSIMDADSQNNQESISVTTHPIGNYLRIIDLSSEELNPGSPLAESFDLASPLKLSSLEIYLAKHPTRSSDASFIIKIQIDENNIPGEVVFESHQTIVLKEQFDWHQFTVNHSLSGGRYWLVLQSENTGAAWHYSYKPLGGAKYEDAPVYFESNSSTLVLSETGWRIIPQKDLTFKIRAQKSLE